MDYIKNRGFWGGSYLNAEGEDVFMPRGRRWYRRFSFQRFRLAFCFRWRFSARLRFVQRIDTNFLDADYAATKAQRHEKKSAADPPSLKLWRDKFRRLTRIFINRGGNLTTNCHRWTQSVRAQEHKNRRQKSGVRIQKTVDRRVWGESGSRLSGE